MPAGRKRTIITEKCRWCGPTGKCRSCEAKYQEAKKAHHQKYEKERYLANKAKYAALGLNTKGMPKKEGWKAGPTLVLNEKLTPIPDEECFEAPHSITIRELKFLI